mmetsp:Transcript_5154/g.11428  ORF Transcript_5154/g.11428 Transcript_5154/m.11428 type:complete len:82 (-) Transcript_5154:158-403(-)
MAVLTSVLAIALLRLQLALGHAFLSYPIGRNFYHRIQGDMYNIAGFDAGGPSALNMANGGVRLLLTRTTRATMSFAFAIKQ